MKCGICKKEIKYEEPPQCYIDFHRSWRGKDWIPEKTVTYFSFIHHTINETIDSEVVSSVILCSEGCLMEWCKDVYENGYWKE